MWKHLLLFLIGIILSVGADAQNYSDNVTLVSIDGDVVTLNSTASAQKRKKPKSRPCALHSTPCFIPALTV